MAKIFGKEINLIPGVNVKNAGKQLGSYVGLADRGDYDVFDNHTTSARPGQKDIFTGQVQPESRIWEAPATSTEVPFPMRTGAAVGGSSPSVDPTVTAEAQRQAALRVQANPLQQALAALDTTLTNRLGEVDQEYSTNMSRYNDAYTQDRARYDENISSNESNLMGQRQNKLVAGARLGANLRSILGSMGALNGTGAFLGNEAVRGITNAGLGEARDTFDANAKVITNNWSEADQGHRQRKEDAESIRNSARANTRADVLGSRQQILNQLGNLFGADTAEGAKYLGDAGALYGQIAGTTRANVPAYQKASSLFSPGALQQYLSGIGNTQVNAAPGAGAGASVPLNSPLYAGPRRREEQLA